MTTIDFRSDTVTKPSMEMKEAMFNAVVGDDVFGEDPTTKELESLASNLFGKSDAVFFPSGTMSNQVAISLHVGHGEELICEKSAHIYNFEGGGIAMHSGASVRLIDGNRGKFSAQDVAVNTNPYINQCAVTKAVSVENTCNLAGGVCWDYSELQEVSEHCRNNNLGVHLDGARVFNAIVASKTYQSEDLGGLFDTISICLSKGLGAPVGSLLIADKDRIEKARRLRTAFGGGMRQSGILAAAGIYALKNNIESLDNDHQLAKQLCSVLSTASFVDSVEPAETNIVMCKVNNNYSNIDVVGQLKEKNVLAIPFGQDRIRFVTHRDVGSDALHVFSNAIKSI